MLIFHGHRFFVTVLLFCILASASVKFSIAEEIAEISAYDNTDDIILTNVSGAAVQRFGVPFGTVCHKLSVMVDLADSADQFPDHVIILRVCEMPFKIINTKTIKCRDIGHGEAWVSVDGLNLTTGNYCLEIFTNSEVLKKNLKIAYSRKSKKQNGSAALGWNGGNETVGDFLVKLAVSIKPVDRRIKPGDDTTKLADRGRANYQIVLPLDSIPAEITAAKVLAGTLKEISGAEFPIILDRQYKSGPMLAVGFNQNLPESLRREHFGELAEQELLILPDRKTSTLLLAGGSGAGTLYAVYDFLYSLGVRWYTPEFTKIPKLSEINLPDKAVRYSPRVTGRSMIIGNGFGNDWLSRSRLTTSNIWNSLGEKYGINSGEGPDMHTFWRLIKKEELQKHPEWMSVVNGERENPIGTTWGLCLSNPEVRSLLVKRTVDYAIKHPDRKIIDIGQNDGSNYCMCEKCKAFYEKHGGQPSSLLVQLTNEVSDALEKKLPGRQIKLLAYSWSLNPPENMSVRDNVIVRFCAAGNFFKPVSVDPEREEMRKAIADWKKLVKHLDVYLYFPSNDYWSPAPCTLAGAENIKWFANNGFDNIFCQVSGFGNSRGSEAMNLRGWLYTRLMWNPDQNVEQLIKEFMRDYYGPAANSVMQAFILTHKNIFDENGEVKKYDNGFIIPDYVNPTNLRNINRMFEHEYKKLPAGEFRNHLTYAWIPYLWADYWTGFRKLGQYNAKTSTWAVPLPDRNTRNRYGKLVKKFMSEHKVNALWELRKFNPSQLNTDTMGVPGVAFGMQDNEARAVVLPAFGGRIFDFRDKNGFAPLKETWCLLSFEYPLFSTTEDAFEGVIPHYSIKAKKKNTVELTASKSGTEISKLVSLKDGVLYSSFRAQPKKKVDTKSHNCIMFDLSKNVFGSYPILYSEKKNGEWTKRVLGTESDFHWIAGDFDFTNSTGSFLLQRENGAEGVELNVKPDQLRTISFWYDRYCKPGAPDISNGILRLFLHSAKENFSGNDNVRIDWQLRIISNVPEFISRMPEK